MNISKYLNPKKYIHYLKTKSIELNFKLGRSFVTETSALGQTILFHVSSYKEYYWRAQASYTEEKSTMHWIENYVKPDDIVYDIGANVGAYSLLIGQRMKLASGKGKIYAFEPESANFSSLNRNIILNELSDQIVAVPIAISDKFKLSEFFLSSNIPGSATHAVDKPVSEGIHFQPTHKQGIISMPLDDFIRLEGTDFPNHIKIDVDGLEVKIVENMGNTLKDTRLKSFIVEVAKLVDKDGTIENQIIHNGFKEKFRETVDSVGDVENILYARS